jgi:hypothetical protein
MQLLFLGRECGSFDDRKLDNPKVSRAELRHEVTAKPEQVADTGNWRRCEVVQTNILVDFGSKSLYVRWRKSGLPTRVTGAGVKSFKPTFS